MCWQWKRHGAGAAGWEHCPLQLVLKKLTLKIILARSWLFPDPQMCLWLLRPVSACSL